MSPLGLATSYVDVTTYLLNAGDFSRIVSDDVELYHQTDNQKPFLAKGKEEVVALFKKYIFDNSSNFDVKRTLIDAQKNIALVRLVVREDKTEEGKKTRYEYDEVTTLTCDKNSIIKIHTTVTKELVAP